MARREGHERGVGPYAGTKGLNIRQDRSVDKAGNPVERNRVIPVDKVQNNAGYSGTVSDKDN